MSAAATTSMRWTQQGRLDGLLATGNRTEDAIMAIFKAAAIQMRSGTDPGRNAADFEALVREAAAKGATYVQTPGNDRRAGARQGSARALPSRPRSAT